MIRTFWLFGLYSLGGFGLETLFAALRTGRLVNRKTMCLLPLCPVYGLGAVLVVWLSEVLSSAPLAVFLSGAVVCSAVEYGYAFVCERLLAVRLWDYGGGKASLHGRVNLLFSLAWGLLSVALVLWVQPVAARLVAAIPAAWFPAAALVLLLDTAVTVVLFYQYGRHGGRVPGCPVAQRAR